ncbi:MAG: S9 family peptidase, partial [Gemmatimonadales bacterium]
MRYSIRFSALALAFGAARLAAQAPTTCTVPHARMVDQVDDYHGTQVRDPYRWLENTDADETKAWVEQENCVTFGYLGQIAQRDSIRARLTALWNYERYGVPSRQGGLYLYSKNDGLQNQSVLYWQRSLAAQAQVLIDPNRLSTDGTVALTATRVSEDGRYLGWGVAVAGSDWNEFRVRDIASGRDLADTLRWIKFSGMSWTHDNAGVFYSRYARPDSNALRAIVRNQRLYYHRIGTDQSADELVYERPDQPDWGLGGG